ncbi:MAG TPA: hypothetical protein VL728_15770 [Cyclobacteriaceae bacterium]|jgi:hypothetical protein|nr:hypothetical protein [Cyclobacteriaceae bacterium]
MEHQRWRAQPACLLITVLKFRFDRVPAESPVSGTLRFEATDTQSPEAETLRRHGIEYKKMAGGFYSYKVEIDDELPGLVLWRYQFENGFVIIVSERDNSGDFDVRYWRNQISARELLAPQPNKIEGWFKEFFRR